MATLRQRGFTIIELVIVLAIVVAIATMVLVGFQNYYRYQLYNQNLADVGATLTEARVQARSSEGGLSRGVKILADSIVVFPGTTYVAGNSANKITALQGITLSPSLSTGGDEIIFNTLTGLPNATGTIAITGVAYNATTSVEITATGVIQ